MEVADFSALSGFADHTGGGDFGGICFVRLCLMLLRFGVVSAVLIPFPANFAPTDVGGLLALLSSFLAVASYWAASTTDPGFLKYCPSRLLSLEERRSLVGDSDSAAPSSLDASAEYFEERGDEAEGKEGAGAVRRSLRRKKPKLRLSRLWKDSPFLRSTRRKDYLRLRDPFGDEELYNLKRKTQSANSFRKRSRRSRESGRKGDKEENEIPFPNYGPYFPSDVCPSDAGRLQRESSSLSSSSSSVSSETSRRRSFSAASNAHAICAPHMAGVYVRCNEALHFDSSNRPSRRQNLSKKRRANKSRRSFDLQDFSDSLDADASNSGLSDASASDASGPIDLQTQATAVCTPEILKKQSRMERLEMAASAAEEAMRTFDSSRNKNNADSDSFSACFTVEVQGQLAERNESPDTALQRGLGTCIHQNSIRLEESPLEDADERFRNKCSKAPDAPTAIESSKLRREESSSGVSVSRDRPLLQSVAVVPPSLNDASTPFTVQKKQLFQYGVRLRFCSFCRMFQPLRTKHCEDCGVCVRTHDHHCPWLGNCVGERSRPKFLSYLIFQTVEIAFYLGQTMRLLFLPLSVKEEWSLGTTFLVLFDVVFLLSVFLLVASLLSYHVLLMSLNLTTWEQLAWRRISYLKVRSFVQKLSPRNPTKKFS